MSRYPLVTLDSHDVQDVKDLVRALWRVGALDPSWDEENMRAKVARALRNLAADKGDSA